MRPPRPKTMDRATFVATFGGIFEHSPWIAEAAYDAGLPADADTVAGLHRALCAALRAAPRDRQRALIAAHPDLAGRLALAGGLTADSTSEQASAGLDRLTAGELRRFAELNDAYRAKFGLPFVMAVRGRSKAEILDAFARRLDHDPASEFATALREIERIAELRLRALWSG